LNPRFRFSVSESGPSPSQTILLNPGNISYLTSSADALHRAASLGDTASMAAILEADPVALNRPHSFHGTTPICWSLLYQKHEATELLLSYNPSLLPLMVPSESYYPIYFLNTKSKTYAPVELEVINRTRHVLFNVVSALASNELYVVAYLQGLFALARCGLDDYAQLSILVDSLLVRLKNFDIEPGLKNCYILITLLGRKTLWDSLGVPEYSDPYIELMAEILDLTSSTPPHPMDPEISHVLFEILRNKPDSDDLRYVGLFEKALRSSPANNPPFQAAVYLGAAIFYMNLPASLFEGRLIDLASQAESFLQSWPHKNANLAEMYAVAGLKLHASNTEAGPLAHALLDSSIKMEPGHSRRYNIFLNTSDLINMQALVSQGQYAFAVKLLEQANARDFWILQNEQTYFYDSYVHFVIRVITSTANHIRKDIISFLGKKSSAVKNALGHPLSVYHECVNILMDHEIYRKIPVSDATFSLLTAFDKEILSNEYCISEAANNLLPQHSEAIMDFLQGLLQLTDGMGYCSTLMANFHYNQLDYDEALEYYVDAGYEYMHDKDLDNFNLNLKSLFYIFDGYNDNVITGLLTRLGEYQKPNTSTEIITYIEQFFTDANSLLGLPEYWLLDFYFEFARDAMNALTIQPALAQVVTDLFDFQTIQEKNVFAENFKNFLDRYDSEHMEVNRAKRIERLDELNSLVDDDSEQADEEIKEEESTLEAPQRHPTLTRATLNAFFPPTASHRPVVAPSETKSADLPKANYSH
jgi:ankyrin repeat protein